MIVRVAKRRRFTTIDNEAVEDGRLSFKALGVLVYLLSRPDGWEADYRHLQTTHVDGGFAVRAGLKELEDYGYIDRVKERRSDGRFEWVQEIREVPNVHAAVSARFAETAAAETHMRETAAAETAPVVKTEEAKTDEVKTEKQQTLVSVPEPGSDADPSFVAFWTCYPRKVDKGGARKAWRAAIKKAAPDTIVEGAQRFARDPNLPPPTYIAHPSTWLNGERWQDGPLPSRFGPSSRPANRNAEGAARIMRELREEMSQ